MKTKKPQYYPVGIQDFEDLRNNNFVYVDKTKLIHKIVSEGKVYFLSRPRRFGKSLLVSTLEAYFLGKKELFEGLYISKVEEDWETYPVFHIDFSMIKYLAIEDLRVVIRQHLIQWEKIYGREEYDEDNTTIRFRNLIRRAYEQTGKQVVVLIDEYDAPLLDTNIDSELQKTLRGELRKFFSPLKESGKYLRFLFLTGITKFSQVSIFSELNNLSNISMFDQYADICGITENELLTQLTEGIQKLADTNNETYEEAVSHLKNNYDGYHFSKNSPDIYNPFSLVSVLQSRKYDNYWFSSGTPTFLIELMQKMKVDFRQFEEVEAMAESFDRATDNINDILPVLYQSGYLTIKSYDKDFKIYNLGYPNEEVKYGFIRSLIPSITNEPARISNFFVVSFIRDLRKGNIESCLTRMQSFFASIPYDLENKTEKHYHTIFYILFTLMGEFIDSEVKTSIGRADAVVKTKDTIYVFEFKTNSTPQEAIEQINSKDYAIAYKSDNRPVVKVGVNFDTETRTLGEWIIDNG